MSGEDSFVAFLIDQLAHLPEIRARRMFGGHGLYMGEVFFGIVHRGRLYFRTTPETRREYRRRGSRPFRVSAKQTLRRYLEVPADVIEDRDLLGRWVRESVRGADEARRMPAGRSHGAGPRGISPPLERREASR